MPLKAISSLKSLALTILKDLLVRSITLLLANIRLTVPLSNFVYA